jgi:hypothetical protein
MVERYGQQDGWLTPLHLFPPLLLLLLFLLFLLRVPCTSAMCALPVLRCSWRVSLWVSVWAERLADWRVAWGCSQGAPCWSAGNGERGSCSLAAHPLPSCAAPHTITEPPGASRAALSRPRIAFVEWFGHDKHALSLLLLARFNCWWKFPHHPNRSLSRLLLLAL